MYPEGGVEEAVVEQLLEQEVRVVRGAGHQVLGQLQESLRKGIKGQWPYRRASNNSNDIT